jgi:hypothetical protein
MSKFTVPIRLADFNISFDSVQTGFKTFYLKNGSLKLNNGTEKDVVLDKKLDNFTPALGVITNNDSVLTALEKMQYAIQSFSSFTCDDLLLCPVIENLIDGVDQLNTDLTAVTIRLTNDENDIANLQNQIQNVLYVGDNISELVNDVGYITATSLPVQYLATEYVDSYIGNRLKPADTSSNGFRFKKSINGSIGYAAINPNTGNGAVASIGVGINDANDYADNAYLAQFGPNYYVSQFAGKAALISSTKLFVGTYGTGDLDFVTGTTFTAMSSRFRILNSGELQIPTVPGAGTTSDFILLRDNTGTIKQISYPDFSGYVPYTGATQNVDLGQYSLSTPIIVNNFNQDYYNQVRLDGTGMSLTTEELSSGEANTFDVLPTNTYSKKYTVAPGFQVLTNLTEPIEVGKIVWNEADGTFDMGLLNDVTLQAGQEMHLYAKASGAIANGDAVQFAGAQGDHLLIKKAVPSEINTNPEYFVGVATQDFTNNQFGYVTIFGQVRGLDTDHYPEGTVLYYQSMGATAGLLTDVRPTGPNAKIIVAAVVRSHQNQGSIFVRPHYMSMLGLLQDVEIVGATSGEVLTYDSSTQLWQNRVLPTPSLQAVTDVENTTTNSIEVYDNNIVAFDLANNKDLGFSANSITQTDVAYFASINFRTRTQSTDFYLEDEGGTKSIATREWTDETKLAKSTGPTYTTNSVLTVTQAEYDAIVTKDPTTLYFIV